MVPTSTAVDIVSRSAVPANAQAVVVFVSQGASIDSAALGEAERKALKLLKSAGAVRGRAKEVVIDVIEAGGGKFRRLVVAGLGNRDKITAENFRQAGGAVVRALRRNKLTSAALIIDGNGSVSAADAAGAAVNGALLAAFDFDQYRGAGRKNEESEESKRLELTVIAPDDKSSDIRTAIERGRIIADGQNFARTTASRPGNDINPPTLAKVAQAMAKEVGIDCRVLDEKQMQKLQMGGILAVGGGSIDSPPRMIVMEYKGSGFEAAGSGKKKSIANRKSQIANGDAPLLIVGKAITFDSGGISIKPAEKMGRMIYDKSGAMAVLGLMYAVAKLRLPVHVVGILSSAENILSSKSYRPGDILRMHNGVTVEVTNTDAEGRLVLGDALAWGIETYKPVAVVDLATLTGGCVIALGKSIAGAMTNNEKLMEQINEAADAAGEKIWRLPLSEDLRDFIRSDSADIVNSAGREGSPLQGGAFLSFFVPPNVPWVHLDIAGVADTEKELPYYAKGSTGWGVRTLVEWVERRAARP